MSRYNLAWLICVPMIVLVGVSLSFTAPSRQHDKDYKLVRTVVDVLAEVDQNFVRPLDDEQKQKFVEDMINGGLEKLDPYSQYMNAEELRVQRIHGRELAASASIWEPIVRPGCLWSSVRWSVRRARGWHSRRRHHRQGRGQVDRPKKPQRTRPHDPGRTGDEADNDGGSRRHTARRDDHDDARSLR